MLERASRLWLCPPAAVRVLIADDSNLMRRMIATRLERSGRFGAVAQAADGREAVVVAGLFRPDVVVLDLSMPGMNGLQALPHLLAAAPHARVIVMSGLDQFEMAPRAFAAGAVRYVEKTEWLDLPDLIDGVLDPPV